MFINTFINAIRFLPLKETFVRSMSKEIKKFVCVCTITNKKKSHGMKAIIVKIDERNDKR